MALIDRNDIATQVLTKYPLHKDKIPESLLIVLRSEYFNSQDFFTEQEAEQIYEAIETLYQLELEGLSKTQLEERAKILIGKEYTLSDNKTIMTLLSKIAIKKERQDIIESLNAIQECREPALQKAKLLKLIKQLSKTFNKAKDIQEILEGLASYIAHDLLEQQVEHMKASLKKEMLKAGFDKPGSAKEMSCSLSVGVGLASATELKTEASVRFTLEVGDNGKIKETKGMATTLTAKAGAQVANVKVSGQGKASQSKTYADIDAWLNANEKQLLKLIVASYRPDKAMSASIDSFLKSREKKAIQKRQSALQEILIMQGLIETGDRLAPFDSNKRKRALKSTSKSLGASLGGSVGMSVLGGGVSAGRTKSKTKWVKHEDFAVYLRDNPDQFFDEDTLGGLFYLIQVKEGLNYSEIKGAYQHLSKLMEPYLDIEEPKNIDTFLYDPLLDIKKYMDALKQLELEYIEYCAIVKKLDAETQKKENLSPREQKAQEKVIEELKRRKANMEKDRVDRREMKGKGKGRSKLKGRAEYYRSILLSYYMIQNSIDLMHLSQELQGQRVSAEELKELKRLEHVFSNPNFRMTAKDHDFLSVPQTLEGKKKHDVYSMEMFGFPISVEKLEVKNANNLDDNGEYIVVSLPVLASSWLHSELSELLSDLESIGITDEISSTLNAQLSSLGGAADFFEIGAQRNMSYVFVKGEDSKYHLQYQRESRTFNLGGKASGNVTAAVTLGGGAKSSATKALHERIGTDTLTYVMTRFNGLDLNEPREVEQSEPWTRFKEENRLAFCNIILALLDTQSNVYLEMQEMHQQFVDSDAPDLSGSSESTPLNERILDAARTYQIHSTRENQQLAMNELEELFRLYHKYVYKPTQAGQYQHEHESPVRQRRNRSPLQGRKKPTRYGPTRNLLKLAERESSPERAQALRDYAEQRQEKPNKSVQEESQSRGKTRKDR